MPGVVITILVLLVLPAVLFLLLQNRFLYFPQSLAVGALEERLAVIAKGEDTYEEVSFATSDGETLVAWLGRPPEPRAWLIWFHGNAGSIEHRFDDFLGFVRRANMAVLLVDYRGYGRSTGSPDEAGLYLDARAAWDYLVARESDPARIFLLGRSIGGAVAVELATEKPARGLILESTFTSLEAMAKKTVPWYPPAWWIARGKFPTGDRIERLTMPILLFHGKADELVPFSHGYALSVIAGENLEFVPVPAAGHNDLSLTMGRDYYERVAAFVDACLGE
ncbi:MAG: alpha/beta hydrolase [Planctomycetota bacterium]